MYANNLPLCTELSGSCINLYINTCTLTSPPSLSPSFLPPSFQGDTYFTVHVTPQVECSYVSFETNLEQESYTSLINKVITIFKPQKCTVSLFASKVGVVGGYGRQVCMCIYTRLCVGECEHALPSKAWRQRKTLILNEPSHASSTCACHSATGQLAPLFITSTCPILCQPDCQVPGVIHSV